MSEHVASAMVVKMDAALGITLLAVETPEGAPFPVFVDKVSPGDDVYWPVVDKDGPPYADAGTT